MKKILIVEDDPAIAALLFDFLTEAGYKAVTAADGVEALTLFSAQAFDLILLDVMLPRIDGFGVCEVIRQKSKVPIFMLTALDSEPDQIRGLDLLVDDYITKPFSLPVLIRRIGAVLRRAPDQTDTPNTITYRALTLEPDEYKAYAEGKSVNLTPREFEIHFPGSAGGGTALCPGGSLCPKGAGHKKRAGTGHFHRRRPPAAGKGSG